MSDTMIVQLWEATEQNTRRKKKYSRAEGTRAPWFAGFRTNPHQGEQHMPTPATMAKGKAQLKLDTVMACSLLTDTAA